MTVRDHVMGTGGGGESNNSASTTEAPRPLTGLRVIDVGNFLPGPYAAAMMGEFGAEVLKVEHPIGGDPMRQFGTPSDRTARVHFNQHVEREGRFGRRIIYGGYIISLARALSFNGLANSISIAAINGGRHTAPTFAGDTIYAWSEILEVIELPHREDVGALRIRTVAAKDRACADFPYQDASRAYEAGVVLDFDYTVFMPRRS